MASRWRVDPVRTGAVTRFLVHRADGSENRGIWDTEKEATDLAERLNFGEFGEGAVIDDVEFE